MQNFNTQVTITGNDKLTAVLRKIEKSVGTLGSSIASLNSKFSAVGTAATKLGNDLKYIAVGMAAVATGLGYLTIKYSENAEQLSLMSQRTGIGTGQLQRLGYAAGQAGLDSDSMSMALKFLNRNIGIAGTTASSDASVAFNAMGIKVRQANGQLKDANTVLLELSDKFKRSADGPQKVMTAIALLGRAGSDLIPLLNEGSTAISKMGDEFERVGHMLTDDEIKRAKTFNDDIKTLGVSFHGLGSIVAGALVPIFDPLVKQFTEFIAANKEFVKVKTVEYVKDFASGIETLWNKLSVIGATITQVVSFFGGFKNILLAVAAVKITDIAMDILMLGRSVALLGSALIASPLGAFALMLGSIVYLVYAINKAFPELGKTIIGTTKNMLKEIQVFFDYLVKKWQQVESVYNRISGKKTYSMDDYNKKVKPQQTVSAPAKVAALSQLLTTQQPKASDDDIFSNPDVAATSIGTIAPAAPPKLGQGGFDGFLQGLQSIIAQSKQQLSMNINLNTQNKVTGMSVDAPPDVDTAVSTGSMWS